MQTRLQSENTPFNPRRHVADPPMSSYHPASSVRLHVAVNHDGRPGLPLREDLHLAGCADAVEQLLRAVCGEGEPQGA